MKIEITEDQWLRLKSFKQRVDTARSTVYKSIQEYNMEMAELLVIIDEIEQEIK